MPCSIYTRSTKTIVFAAVMITLEVMSLGSELVSTKFT